MRITRRALPLLALAAATSARAETLDLSVACDTTLAPALRKVGAAYTAKTSSRVFVFPTGPGLILAQLQRDIQNDIVITLVSTLEQLRQAGIISVVPAAPRWTNSVVIAGSSLDQTVAAPDPTPASDIDGPALLGKLALQPKHLLGAVDTDEVVSLLISGEAQAGLLHMSDVRAHGLSILRPVPSDILPPFRYAASVTRLASRPNPQAFIAFLATVEANALLTAAGLEGQS
jgi:molybdate transport system substrate-binding protein